MRRSIAAAPRSVPMLEPDSAPDAPFAEGVADDIDPDLRYRLISEAAYAMYEQRGHQEGYQLDDWLRAEAQVDHLLTNSADTIAPDGTPQAPQ